jgi:predicted nuclease with TOPRIM domain
MSDAEKAYQATPASTLEEQIMNPCIAKNEREWWAAAEIERLNRELDDVWNALVIQREDNASFGDAFKRQAAEIERLRAELAEAERKIELLYEDLAGDSL